MRVLQGAPPFHSQLTATTLDCPPWLSPYLCPPGFTFRAPIRRPAVADAGGFWDDSRKASYRVSGPWDGYLYDLLDSQIDFREFLHGS